MNNLKEKKDLLFLACVDEKERQLTSLLKTLNNNNASDLVAEILAFKNSLLLGKSNLSKNDLKYLLLKHYILLFFSEKKALLNDVLLKKSNLISIFDNFIVTGDINNAFKALNDNMSIMYYLSYVYITTLKTVSLSRASEIRKDYYDYVIELLNNLENTANNNNLLTEEEMFERTRIRNYTR